MKKFFKFLGGVALVVLGYALHLSFEGAILAFFASEMGWIALTV